jgi:hypothetical protein
MVYVKADIPEDVHTKIRVHAAKEDATIDTIVRKQLIEAYSE